MKKLCVSLLALLLAAACVLCLPGKAQAAVALQPNPNQAEKPVIVSADYFSVTLQHREGYEYSLDGVTWQDSPVFTMLYSNEERTFYQRIKATEEWEASAASQATIGHSLGYGKSTGANFAMMWEYVDIYGTTNSNGVKQVAFASGSNVFYLELRGKDLYGRHQSISTGSTVSIIYNTYVLFKHDSKYFDADMVIEMYYNNRLMTTYEPSASIDRTTFTQDTIVPLDGIEAGSDISNVYNASVKQMIAACSLYFAERNGLTFTDIGFFAFVPEITRDICDPAAGVHKGSRELRYRAEATCLDDGYTGDYCCSFCGEVMTAGTKLEAAGSHSYDHGCDTTCNTCGWIRSITHSWGNTLLSDGTNHWTGCEICGEKRDVTPCAGGQATCGTPATCDTCHQHYGDVLPCERTVQVVDSKYLKSAATCIEQAVYFESCPECLKPGTATFTHGQLNPENHGGGYTYQNPIPETCTEPGYQGDRYCGGCGVSLGRGDPIPPQHSFTNYISNQDATYDADGTETAKCDRCSATDTRTDAGSRIIVTGWYVVNGKWCYYDQGVKAVSKWVRDSKGWCYLDVQGHMVYNKWVKDSIGWCYVGADGYMVYNKWVKDSIGWCYVGADGYMVYNKWVKDSKGWCYVGADGYMVYNKWVRDSKGWCYVGADGYMVYNKWVKDSKGWCYVGANGYMTVNDWVKSGGKWYFCNSSGYMATGWVKTGGNWYYMDSSGAMITGWKQLGGKWYYFYNSGIMATNVIMSGGYINGDGVWDPNGTPYDRVYNKLIYSDSRVDIYFYQLAKDRVWFKVKNKTSEEITIQADSIALNRNSTDNIIMSSDIAPYSTGYADAKCSFPGIYTVGQISGQLRVISFGGAFKTYTAPFVNITVDSTVAVQTPSVSAPLVYSDEKVDIYFKEATSDGVYFTVRNKTDINITIQANSVSVNGYSTDRITMSDDVAPGCVGVVRARCTPGATGSAVYKVGGTLRIIDFNHSFDTYSASFANISV